MDNLNDIMRLDFGVDEYVCNSDGVPVCSTGRQSFAVLFNKNQISEDEVMKIVENGPHINDDRVVVMPISMADKLKKIMSK